MHSATTCSAGVCGGGVGPTVYFAEDFHDNSKGWLLGPEWQIGPSQASQGGVYGADLATDHSSSADNGVAGVVIGGNETPSIHAYYYIESPPFDTSSAVGSVVLGYQRWLNSDYDPYMHNRVEVYNGSQWIVVWQTGSALGIQDSPPTGLGWTFQQLDLTAYKNAAMKVRFGYDIGSQGGLHDRLVEHRRRPRRERRVPVRGSACRRPLPGGYCTPYFTGFYRSEDAYGST